MKVSVIGIGKTGLPMAVGLLNKGHEVWGVDVREERLAELRDPNWSPSEPDCEYEVRKDIHLTTNLEEAVRSTALSVLIVNTPESSDGIMDLTQIKDAARGIGESLHGKTHSIIVSATVMPGTCEEVIAPLVGPNCTVISNPVWIALGSVMKDYLNPPVLLYGCNRELPPSILKFTQETYNKEPEVTDLKTAEAIKILYNIWCTTKMAWTNYAAHAMRQIGGDPFAMERFMKNGGERVGIFLRPGAPWGGPCFPRDLRFATKFSEGYWTEEFVRAIGDVNDNVKWDIIGEVRQLIEPQHGHIVGIVGMTYKPGVAVTEESPSLDLAHSLRLSGYMVTSYDPLVKSTHNSLEELLSASDVLVEMLPDMVPADVPLPVVRPWGR